MIRSSIVDDIYMVFMWLIFSVLCVMTLGAVKCLVFEPNMRLCGGSGLLMAMRLMTV